MPVYWVKTCSTSRTTPAPLHSFFIRSPALCGQGCALNCGGGGAVSAEDPYTKAKNFILNPVMLNLTLISVFDLLWFFSPPAAGGSLVLFWEACVEINWEATYSFVVLVGQWWGFSALQWPPVETLWLKGKLCYRTGCQRGVWTAVKSQTLVWRVWSV